MTLISRGSTVTKFAMLTSFVELQKVTILPQIDLQYPKRGKPAATSSQSPKPEPVKEKRPTFGEVLETSLKAEGETRAWINDQLKYQYVRQTRHLLQFPQVRYLMKISIVAGIGHARFAFLEDV